MVTFSLCAALCFRVGAGDETVGEEAPDSGRKRREESVSLILTNASQMKEVKSKKIANYLITVAVVNN